MSDSPTLSHRVCAEPGCDSAVALLGRADRPGVRWCAEHAPDLTDELRAEYARIEKAIKGG